MNNYNEIFNELKDCTVCPRNCHVNRFTSKLGYCKSDASYNIASIVSHYGEEPVISGAKGICNVFFTHCNLQCVYCQNYQISRNCNSLPQYNLELSEVIEKILAILDTGCNSVGFVSPSHFVPQVKIIINELHKLGRYPTIVYNTNSYDKVDTLKQLEDLVDIYLADFKYINSNIAKKYSDANNYPKIASMAIKEMYRQKGSTLIVNENNQAESGLIIRHLVLPNNVDNSINLFKYVAEEISTNVYISLMSQYYPTIKVQDDSSLNRTIRSDEYKKVVDVIQNFGFHNGWIQEIESQSYYLPDFNKEIPF
ncbi:MAG: radical SAM protein [Bacteroidetes bacterium]|nr:radical SAM protein [Bacteroidota bacterium]